MRFSRILALLIVASLLLSACGPAVQTAADEMLPNGQRFLLSLPRLVIDFDTQGRPSLDGYGLADVQRLTGLQLQPIALNPFYVNWMTYTNIQHIEVVHSSNGLFLFVNGQAMPHLAWDSGTLGNLTSMAGMFLAQPYAKLISLLVPVLERTGLGIAVTFPRQEGVEAIPLRDPSVPPVPLVAEGAELKMVAHIDINYDENGVPTMAGISTRDVLETAGFFVPAELTPETIDLIQAYGIKEFRVINSPDGVFLEVNGMPLPHIAWNNAALQAGANFYAQMNPDSPYIELANLLVPQLGSMDVDIAFKFPG